MIYTSVNNSKIKNIKRLNLKKYRDKMGLFLIEGEHLIKEAFDKNQLVELIVLENFNIDLEIDKIYVTDKVMKSISELDTPPKVIGICKKMKEKPYGNRIVILDDIQDPGNLGTIIRSCVAFNCDTLLLSEHCVDLYNSKVIRASQGLLFHLNIVSDNLIDAIPKLKQEGYTIIGTDVNKGSSVKQFEKIEKFVIIMGNEGSGVAPEIQDMCDEFLYINMNSNCESLNVGVATSIILYELNK